VVSVGLPVSKEAYLLGRDDLTSHGVSALYCDWFVIVSGTLRLDGFLPSLSLKEYSHDDLVRRAMLRFLSRRHQTGSRRPTSPETSRLEERIVGKQAAWRKDPPPFLLAEITAAEGRGLSLPSLSLSLALGM
jgi:hypothetical protein